MREEVHHKKNQKRIAKRIFQLVCLHSSYTDLIIKCIFASIIMYCVQTNIEENIVHCIRRKKITFLHEERLVTR